MYATSEKQQLEEEIAQLLRDNPTRPTDLGLPINSTTRIELQSWAKERKKLAEKRERLELIYEEERIQALMQEVEELHPRFECPLCLEEVNRTDFTPLICCGQGTCQKCSKEYKNHHHDINICCPLCRDKSFGTGKDKASNIQKFAERGEAWAQIMMGDIFMGEDKWVKQKVDKAKAREWYELAKDQGDAEGIFKIAEMEKEEDINAYFLPDQANRRELKWAAELGSTNAAATLASHYMFDTRPDDCDPDYNGIQRYASLALGGSLKNEADLPFISSLLGFAFLKANPEISQGEGWTHWYRVKYYLDIGAKTSFDCVPVPNLRPTYCNLYATTLYILGHQEYDGYTYEIPGFSFWPKVQYWATKRVKADLFEGERCEHHCANCNCMASADITLQRCAKCMAAWYCSNQCQIESWKAGHKFDCNQRSTFAIKVQ